MKKLFLIPILFLLFCCTTARDRQIVNDFMSAQSEVQNGDSVYIHRNSVNVTKILNIYENVTAEKEEGKMEMYYYYPDTLSIWPFSGKEIFRLKKKSYTSYKWQSSEFNYDEIKFINKDWFQDKEFLVNYVENNGPITYSFSRPLVKGKTALLYFSAGWLLHGPNKHGVFVLKKVKGKWQEVGMMNKLIYY